MSKQFKLAFSNYASIIERVVLGSVFIFAGVAKIPNIKSLIWEMQQYQLVPASLVPIVSYILPYFEIVLGVLLILGMLPRLAALGSSVLLLAFTIAKVSAMIRGIDLETCPCFGASVALHSTDSLILGIVLFVLSLHLLIFGKNFFSLDTLISAFRHERKSA